METSVDGRVGLIVIYLLALHSIKITFFMIIVVKICKKVT